VVLDTEINEDNSEWPISWEIDWFLDGDFSDEVLGVWVMEGVVVFVV
jgi:hypothetical protein